jgi:hypothetical protein
MINPIQGGAQAKKTGTVLERFILLRLTDSDYIFVPRDKFTPSRILGQPIYTRHFHVGDSIYGTPQYCDFIVYHPQKWPDNLIIESKWQQTGGSVDEKYPYLVLNIQMQYKCPTILVLDGGGYKKGAERWIRSQSGNANLKHVFNMKEFATWVNKGNL